VAEKLRKGVEEELIAADNTAPIKMTISIGVSASHSGEKASSTEILKKADIALYKAKNNGRNMVCVH
jgi:diguanylate cyclase (GGDEF)-like protein